MEETHTIALFLKFGQREYIEDLFDRGTIYMNSLQHFRALESDLLRGDRYEGIAEINNYPAGQFHIPSLNYTGNYLALQTRTHDTSFMGNIYSLYCISSHGFASPKDFKLHTSNAGFGDRCLLVKDNPEFLRRIRKAVTDLGYDYTDGFVEYYDDKIYSGKVGPFKKPMGYEHQKEFRLFVPRQSDDPLILKVGSLHDIAELRTTTEIIEGLKVQAGSNSAL